MTLRARIERLLSPGLGRCYRCERPWRVTATRRVWGAIVPTRRQIDRDRFWGLVGVDPHTTPYGGGQACFPLCEGCWSGLTPKDRLPYYNLLLVDWQRLAWFDDRLCAEVVEKAPRIYAAVWAGL